MKTFSLHRAFDILSLLRKWVRAHTMVSIVVAAVALGGGYYAYGKLTAATTPMKYSFTTATTDTLITAVSGSGQVSPSSAVEVKPKVSGDVVSVVVQNGDYVEAGQALAYLDSTDAQKNVNDARSSLKSSQIALEKLQKPADTLSLTQSQNNIAKAQEQLDSAQTDLTRAYQDAYNDVVATYLDLPSIMIGLKDVVIGTQASHGSQWNIDYYKNAVTNWDNNAFVYRDNAYSAYNTADTTYNKALLAYQQTSQTSDTATIESILQTTYTAAQNISTSLGSANSLLRFYEDQQKAHDQTPSTVADTGLTNLNSYITKLNGHITSLLADINTIKSDKQTIASAQRSITESQQSLDKLKAGTDALDIESAKLTIEQKQNALQAALNTLSDYTIRAPISGTVAGLTIHKGDTIGSTAVATIMSKQQMADLSLNEVDAAKVAVGQKASMTFDAVDGLTISGTVADVNPLGTVSQGVVSYDVKIAMDTNDTRVRAGMSTNASIVTNIKQNALIVPSSAVKTTKGSGAYVQIFSPYPDDVSTSSALSLGVTTTDTPTQVPVTVGLSNDTEVEITSGLSDGDVVVSRAVSTATTATTASSNTNILGALSGRGGPGGGGGGAAGGARPAATGGASRGN